MPDLKALAAYYETRTDAELLNLKIEGGFTQEAERVFSEELRRRNLGVDNIERYKAQGELFKLREEATEKGNTLRGSGLLFFGRRYMNEEDRHANVQVRTKWFALSWIPLIPIASYRFQCPSHARRRLSDGGQRVINRVPLDWAQVFVTWFKTAILCIGAGLLIVGIGEAKKAFGW